nr:hypothetical protein [Tanacetum cinerariifolium]
MLTAGQGENNIDIEKIVNQRVAEAMVIYEAKRNIRNGPHQDTSGSEGGVVHTTH